MTHAPTHKLTHRRSPFMARCRAVLACLVCVLLALCAVQRAWGQASKDLPNPTPNLIALPDGSLVIAMDNTNQALVAPFNLKAYGLVNNLLQNGIPVWWAIRAGKAKDGVDFTASAQRISPTITAVATYNFAGGPFIIHRDFAALARTRIAAFANQVAVYELKQNAGQSVTVDIRYQLTLRPNIAISNTNSTIHTDVLDAAVIPNYTVVDPVNLSAAACYTSHSEPHTTLTPGVPKVKAFVLSGGNFLAQCKASFTYENDVNGHFQTTNGDTINNIGNTLTYPNADLSFSQFVGALDPAPGGSEQDWSLAAGSVFQNNAHIHADNVGASPATYAATGAKLYNAGPGGMVYYLGGHNYNTTTDITNVNGRRMYLNFVLTPSTRPSSCGLGTDFAAALRTISGTVYEDVNGDSNLADGVRAQNVNVRLYADVNNNGVIDTGDTYLVATTTDLSGNYSFQVSTAASGTNYLVAVDSKSVAPGAGLIAGRGQAWAEQTYGDNATTAALDLGARFGGRQPGVSDSFNTSDTTPANNNYQHLARADVSLSNITNANFGFSFNVVTNLRAGDTADDDTTNTSFTVQGSVRQFIQNANAIVGANALRFVPAVALNLGSYWQLSVTNTLPAIIDGSTTIDGLAYNSADGTSIRDTNTGQMGTGGTIGVGALALAQVARPELEIVDGSTIAVGLDVQAANTIIRRVAIYGFGNTANNDAHANIRLTSAATGALLELNVIGTTAATFADPGATRSGGDNIRAVGVAGGTLRNNLIGFSAGKGIQLGSGSSGWLVEYNEVRGNGVNNSNLGGLDNESSGSNTIRYNLFAANEGAGVDCNLSSGSNLIQNNTLTGNGVGAGANVVTPGVRLYGPGNTVQLNIVNANYGAGVMVSSSSTGNRLTQNSIFANGTILTKTGGARSNQLGIDLLSAGNDQSKGTSPFVTINDAGDGDAGGNGLLNFPVLVSAQLLNGNLLLTGYAAPGAAIEFFIAESPPDPSGFGEGQTYLLTLTEGSAADTDATTGTYTSPINGLNVGTDTTNKFSFTIPVPAGVGVNTALSATATVAGSTSEFSGNVTALAAPPNVTLDKNCTSPANCTTQPQVPNTDLTYTIQYTNGGGSAAQNLVIIDGIPANTDFKPGSVVNNFGTTGLTAIIAYSNDNGASYTYTPASGAGGAPAGYDRAVTHIRWTFSGGLSQITPNNTGSVSFTVRIR